MADLVIYGTPVSPFVRKVEAVLIEKRCEYDLEAVNVFDPPDWFAAISPLKTIPVLRDRRVAAQGPAGTIADSSAICGFLERRFPDPALYPADPHALGRALFVEEFADTKLAATGGLGIFRALYFPTLAGEAPDMAKAQATWDQRMPPLLDHLESVLAGGEFMVGKSFSIADIAVAVQLMQIALVAEAAIAPRWPGLAAWLERANALPALVAPFAQAQRHVRKSLPEPVRLES